MKIQPYLNRIQFNGEIAASKQVLFELHRNHLMNVPFENLDIHYNHPIILDQELIAAKIIDRNRGGFCYELNALFNLLLNRMGFQTKLVAARVFGSDHKYGPEFDHMAIVVNLDEVNYLVDVGFGKFILEPLTIDFTASQSDPLGAFRFVNLSNDEIRIDMVDGSKSTPQYIFSLKERSLKEFKPMCHYHQTHPDSHFTRNKVVSKCTKEGRITLLDTELKISSLGENKSIQFMESDFENFLKKHFDMEVK